MKGLFAFGAVVAGVANAAYAPRGFLNTTTSSVEMTTSTIITTSVHTVTACPSTVKDCPVGPHLTTETIIIGTTVCPVSSTTSVGPTAPTTTPPPVPMTTSTLYTTKVHTVTACPSTVKDCPVGPHVTTETIVIGTTVCPVSTNTTIPVPPPTSWTTSTVYTTKVHTVTACPSTVKDCPVGPHLTTETIAVSTTVCPVTVVPPPVTTQLPPPPPAVNSTSILYSTKTWVTKGKTTTAVIATGTTKVPVIVPPPFTSSNPTIIVPPLSTVQPSSQAVAPTSQAVAPTKPSGSQPTTGASQPTTGAPQPTPVTAGAARNGLEIAAAAAGVVAFFL